VGRSSGPVRYPMSPAPSPVLPVQDARPDAPADACGSCPHPLSAHDAISLRFCRATRDGDLPRGCACPSA
jgi:hypothetical protein